MNNQSQTGNVTREARAADCWDIPIAFLLSRMTGALLLAGVAVEQHPCVAQRSEIGLHHQSLYRRTERDSRIENGNYLQAFLYAGERIGGWGNAYRQADYLSAAIGPFYDVTDWCELGVALGFESVERADGRAALFGRIATILWLGVSKVSFMLYVENGTSHELWYQAEANWRLRKSISLGVLAQSNAGIGPRIVIHVPLLWLEVWATPMLYNQAGREVNAMAGASLVYSRPRD